jgi:DNA-binding beta-propeller fold protein YncE
MNRREFVAFAAAAPFALRRLGAAPRVLVTCDSEARLAVVDLGAFHVVHSIAVLPDPRSIELAGEHAVVCHTAVGAVSIVDLAGRVRHVVRGFVEPRYTAAHPGGRIAFVTDSGRSSVAAVDVLHGKIVRRVRLREWARHLTLAGDRLWVGLGSASPDVAIVDLGLRHVATVTPPFPAHDVVAAPDGRIWVTSGTERRTAIYSAAGRLLHELAADLAPQHVTFGGGVAFVTSGDSGTLRVHDLAGRPLRETAVPQGSYNVQFGGGRVFTPSLERGTLAVAGASGAPLLARVQVADSCHDACLAPGIT